MREHPWTERPIPCTGQGVPNPPSRTRISPPPRRRRGRPGRVTPTVWPALHPPRLPRTRRPRLRRPDPASIPVIPALRPLVRATATLPGPGRARGSTASGRFPPGPERSPRRTRPSGQPTEPRERCPSTDRTGSRGAGRTAIRGGGGRLRRPGRSRHLSGSRRPPRGPRPPVIPCRNDPRRLHRRAGSVPTPRGGSSASDARHRPRRPRQLRQPPPTGPMASRPPPGARMLRSTAQATRVLPPPSGSPAWPGPGALRSGTRRLPWRGPRNRPPPGLEAPRTATLMCRCTGPATWICRWLHRRVGSGPWRRRSRRRGGGLAGGRRKDGGPGRSIGRSTPRRLRRGGRPRPRRSPGRGGGGSGWWRWF
jgi:hypothetical protein